MAIPRQHLGTIQESGLSDVQLSTSTHDEDDEDELFIYPGNEEVTNARDEGSDEETFVYPSNSIVPSVQPQHASPAQLESLYAAASSGDLSLLKRLIHNAQGSGSVQPFSLVNDASSRTGLTALHAAASRGYIEMVKWLVEDCGAMPDLEDKEGETAIHKAALHGHLSVLSYLVPDKADVHCKDADGWTALHNACAKGYLNVVRWLCEQGGAASELDGVRGVDIRSKGGWTPLMNAASKGHLPIVLYLLNKQSVNPLIRNNWGETAFDIAAAVFEVWICEVLQRSEAQLWADSAAQYNPIAVHTTIPLVLYEYQKLDTRLKTLAVSGGKPKFSASGLGKPGRKPPFELRLPTPIDSGEQQVAAWRSDVQLPLLSQPTKLPLPAPTSRTESDVAERSHFWLSDWTLDVTHPKVDADEGWQYAFRFNVPDEEWTPDMPPQVERQLTGHVTYQGWPSGSRHSHASSSSGSLRAPHTCVRRRRWVRLMRRRLDIPPLPFLEPDGQMYLINTAGDLVPYEDADISMTSPNAISGRSQDYVARARYIVDGEERDSTSLNMTSSTADIRRIISKLERATIELRHGISGDNDIEHRTQAEVLFNAYTRELERSKQFAHARGIQIAEPDDVEPVSSDEEDSDEEFHYPVEGQNSLEGQSRRSSYRSSSSTTGYSNTLGREISSNDLTPQLSQAPDFRVPTHEAPQKIFTANRNVPHPIHPQWERDETVTQCRDCQRRFTFLLRRHHCRRCGRIFCDRCSSFQSLLDPSEVIHGPMESTSTASSHRVCQTCFDQINSTVPGMLRGGVRQASMERVFVDQQRLTIPGRLSRQQSTSQLSDLAECPVCNKSFHEFRSPAEQEAHVKHCLEGGSGSPPQLAKYLVYRLPAESVLIGVECVICLEEFVRDSTVARLSCFCSFHSQCLSSWLQRGKSCPVHSQ